MPNSVIVTLKIISIWVKVLHFHHYLCLLYMVLLLKLDLTIFLDVLVLLNVCK